VDATQAVFLGILQGLTEFLPVSSSGHLVLAQHAAGLQLQNALAFDVALHGGTLASVLLYFRDDLWGMTTSLGGSSDPEAVVHRRWIALLALASVPVAVVGLLAADIIEGAFHSIALVGTALIGTAGLLWLASRRPAGGFGAADLGWRDALQIGCFQVLGLIPGVSRAGSTLVGGLLRGVDRETAARFSFLLAIPAISGAILKNASDLSGLADTSPVPVAAGVIAAAITGVVAIEVMMRAVRSGRLLGFALYCLIVGGAALIWSVAIGG
jgi:undecaprenyl-diphosphatase